MPEPLPQLGEEMVEQTRAALMLVTAAYGRAASIATLVGELQDEGKLDLPLLLGAVLGVTSSLLALADRDDVGAAEKYLACVGRAVEAAS